MKVVVVGSGAREHALAHVLGRTAEVLTTPGNPGIPASTSTSPEDIDADLFVIGPEQPLVSGLADRLRTQGKLVFGPGADGAQLEGSKIWMKQLLEEAGVPTAPFRPFYSGQESAAKEYLLGMKPPYVVKTDYLAAGKGVLVTEDFDCAVEDVRTKLEQGNIVIEQGLSGEEVSFFAICSGNDWVFLPTARDYKRLLDSDEGPNTGGMGAFSPTSDSPTIEVLDSIVDKTLATLRRRGIDYRGVLYGGLILTEDGPMVLEYNIRLGDPETQVVLLSLASDLTEMLALAAEGKTPTESVGSGACVTVVLASEGYPTNPVTGDVISGIEEASTMKGVTVFHAGVSRNDQGRLTTSGGRVLSVTAKGNNVEEARKQAYEAVKLIHFRGMHYRTDIALLESKDG